MYRIFRLFMMFFFLFGSLSAQATANTTTATPESSPPPTVTISVPFGGHIQQKTAEAIASAAAQLRLWDTLTTLLAQDMAAQFATNSLAQQQALASALFPLHLTLSVTAHPSQQDGEQLLVAVAVMTPPNVHDDASAEESPQEKVPQDEQTPPATSASELETPEFSMQSTEQREKLCNALRQTDNLELRLHTLKTMQALADEGISLLERSHRNRKAAPAMTNDPFLYRLEYLAGQLHAQGQYLTCLAQFDSSWQEPHTVLPVLTQILPLDSQNPLLHLGIGEALMLLERPHEALDALHQAVTLPNAPARAHYIRGLAHLRLQLLTFADDDFSQALERRPEKASWWRARGAARWLSGNTKAMCGDFYQACALGDCEGLLDARKQDFCAPAPASPPAPVSQETPSAETTSVETTSGEANASDNADTPEVSTTSNASETPSAPEMPNKPTETDKPVESTTPETSAPDVSEAKTSEPNGSDLAQKPSEESAPEETAPSVPVEPPHNAPVSEKTPDPAPEPLPEPIGNTGEPVEAVEATAVEATVETPTSKGTEASPEAQPEALPPNTVEPEASTPEPKPEAVQPVPSPEAAQ